MHIGHDDVGTGEPVVLLHSSCQSRRQWRKLVPRLQDRYRVLAVDLCGYGETGFPPDPDAFTIADEAALVARILEGVDRPAHLVGHSYGGAVALATALRHRDAVRTLTLHEPVAFHLVWQAGLDPVIARVSALASAVERQVAAGDLAAACRSFIDYWSGDGTWEGIAESRRPEFLRTIRKVPLDFRAITTATDSVSDYASMGIPIRLTTGTTEPDTARAVARLLADAIGTSSLEQVEGVGHMAPVTDAHLINPLIEAHIAAHPVG